MPGVRTEANKNRLVTNYKSDCIQHNSIEFLDV